MVSHVPARKWACIALRDVHHCLGVLVCDQTLMFYWKKNFLTTREYSDLPQISVVTLNEWLCICTLCETGVVCFHEFHEKASIVTVTDFEF